MTEDAKVSIKLEVCRDKTSGKLSITAHFNSNAPNIIKDKDGYCWMPTVEEKDLLNEAFELFPVDGGYVTPMKSASKDEDKKEDMSMPEPMVGEELEPEPEPLQPEGDVKEPADLLPLEAPNESDVFEATDDHIKNDEKMDDSKVEELIIDEPKPDEPMIEEPKPEEPMIDEPMIDEPKPDEPMIDEPKPDEPMIEEPMIEEPKPEEQKPDEPEGDKKEYGEDMVVEADQDAIEAALKKHTKEDETLVEADEQTIIDKVLSQKKKGRWSKR